MYLPNRLQETNNRAMVDTWRGYNHNFRIPGGEFWDMENMSSDYTPILTPRKKRSKLIQGENIRGILLTDDRVCYLEGDTLYYGTKHYDISPYVETKGMTTDQTLLRFGAYILIYPQNVYVNLYNDDDIGSMEQKYDTPAGTRITYTMCDADGNDFENVVAGPTPPENPADGMYWLNTDPETSGLNIWVENQSMWQPVATTYVRIEIPGSNIAEYFKQGDTVTFTSYFEDINDGSTIQKIKGDTLVVIGILPDEVVYTEDTDESWTLKIRRKLPQLDYYCVSNNRVWGCHYGSDGKGGVINEIYASKLGDFTNWYTYEGLTTDSYAVSIGDDGAFTGCIAYQGKPAFFKENHIYRIYGSYPAEYQLVTNNVRGVQKGSSRSLTVLNEYLIYKSSMDVVVYDGTTPVSISKDLGRDQHYYSAAAGATLNKYYISMQDALGKKFYFVYDMENDIWTRENAFDITGFTTSESGQVYCYNPTEIYGIGTNDNMLFLNPLPGEDMVKWWCETGDIAFEFPDYKKPIAVALRAYVPHDSEIQVWISYDDGPFEEKAVVRGNAKTKTQVVSFKPMSCDHYRLKFVGHGYCRIYTLTTTFDPEGGLYG